MLESQKGLNFLGQFYFELRSDPNSMYLKHYGLIRQPFKLTSDPDFLWTGEKHQAALEVLKDGILNNKGFVLLTGEVGTGKSTLVTAFPKLNEIATITVTIPDPDMDALDFCNFLASEFGMQRTFSQKDEFIRKFKEFLLRSFAAYKKVLVIIDEAQRLNHDLLQEIRQLATIEMAGRRLLKIFFVGQPEFCTMLMEERNAAIRTEVVAGYNIEPLVPQEVGEYIGHRLEVAGSKRSLFGPRAIMGIAVVTGGFPRTINVLCDHCLLKGFETGIKVIELNTVGVCAKMLGLRPVVPKPEKFVFPFPLQVLDSDNALVAEPKSRRISICITAAAIFTVLALTAGYLVHSTGSHEPLLRKVQSIFAPFLP